MKTLTEFIAKKHLNVKHQRMSMDSIRESIEKCIADLPGDVEVVGTNDKHKGMFGVYKTDSNPGKYTMTSYVVSYNFEGLESYGYKKYNGSLYNTNSVKITISIEQDADKDGAYDNSDINCSFSINMFLPALRNRGFWWNSDSAGMKYNVNIPRKITSEADVRLLCDVIRHFYDVTPELQKIYNSKPRIKKQDYLDILQIMLKGFMK